MGRWNKSYIPDDGTKNSKGEDKAENYNDKAETHPRHKVTPVADTKKPPV